MSLLRCIVLAVLPFSRPHRLFIAAITVLTCFQYIFQVLADDESFEDNTNGLRKCTDLLLGQYLCAEPDIDPETQQAANCPREEQKVYVLCTVAPGIECDGLFPNGTFQQSVPCKWTNGHSFETALLLSVFLGMFGVDRFYLGYPAIGLLKFATLGFMFLGQLIDILLIATQVLTPSDGSAYVLDYYGAAAVRIVKNNETYLIPGN